MNIDKILKKQKGAIILLFLIFLPFMLGFVGLAVDLSYIYAEKTKLQNAADAAALAGVVHLQDSRSSSDVIHPREYVKAMLAGNSFETVGDEPEGELSATQNWKLNYLQRRKNSNDEITTTEVTKPIDANRLKVTLLKQIPLTFIPIVAPSLATIDLQGVAVAQGTMTAPEPVIFQILTRKTLVLGSCIEGNIDRPGSGDVHIPSYPSSYAPPPPNPGEEKKPDKQDPLNYEDYGQYLDRNIYAEKIDFKADSTLRIAGKFVTAVPFGNKPATLFLTDNNNYLPKNNQEEHCTQTDIDNLFDKAYNEGIKKYKDARDGSIKAIFINLYNPNESDKTSFTYTDYNMLSLRESGKYLKSDHFDGLDIIVPVIFHCTDENNNSKPFTVTTNISFFNFTNGLIVIEGSLVLSGSKTPLDAPNDAFGESKRKNTTFNGVYCYKSVPPGEEALPAPDSDPDAPAGGKPEHDPSKPLKPGSFLIAGGASAPKIFEGVIYADAGIRINACKDYRRHIFSNTIISPNDIIFGADHYSTTIKPVCYRFETVQPGSKISLVE